MKAYEVLIVIRPPDGDFNPGGPIGAFRKEYTDAANPPSPFLILQIHITLQCGPPKWCRHRKLVELSPLSAVKQGPNTEDANGRH